MPSASDFRLTTRNYNLTAAQKLVTGATSVQSAAIGAQEVLLVATVALWFNTGINPTAVAATAGNVFMAAGEKFHMQIDPTWKIAAIQDTAAGSLHIIPIG